MSSTSRSDKRRNRRKPYAPPEIRTDKIFERYGLACGKDNPMVPACIKNIMS